ncbi:hypothetical protein HJC23_005487 [Cyclotella cryptica]|uniref:Glycosyltransferase 61 catalytic domain-containing protein n=1 Tax=Cyclotella cryptica TaxID=29204 RepID=A0ABD3PI40_9STRA|eukprot:CCRYP_014868-RA/>CCRYP_014868-RA protein AED:0.01 eAED:0.01 QI:341/1/1/1/1/1/2/562/715
MSKGLGRHKTLCASSSRDKNLIVVYSMLLCILIIQFAQFRGNTLLSSMKEEINQESVIASHNLRNGTAGRVNSSLPGSSPVANDSKTMAHENQQATVSIDENIQTQPQTAANPTSSPSYSPTYIPTSSSDDNEDSESFDWEFEGDRRGHAIHGLLPGKTCHVVENICRRPSEKHWFYFRDHESAGLNPKHLIGHPKQPLLSYIQGSRSRISMDIASMHPNATWIKDQQCKMSPIENHVVLNGDHIHMMGEYIQRIVLPLKHIMDDYVAHSTKKSRSEMGKEIQFYINFHQNEHQKVLPSHHLYMNGLPHGQDLQSWSETLDPVYGISSPQCQCYTRLVFCGFQAVYSAMEMNATNSTENITMLQLSPDSTIPWNLNKHCANYIAPTEALETEDCQVWQDLRKSLIETYEEKNPNLSQDIHGYRIKLINKGRQYVHSDANTNIDNVKDWKIIGLSQRKGRRMWLNINETLSHCNKQYNEKLLACVEVDVEDLPTNFVSAGSNSPLSSMDEQFVLYRSIDALIGIHGSQLTQGILMPSNSVMVELFQWIPQHWGISVWGDGWTNQKNHPTPMGIMWHNTDINEAGWCLPRESVPLCQNVSDLVMHNFSLDTDAPSKGYETQKGGAGATELEHCLQVLNGNDFRWDYRNFNVGLDMIEKFVKTFFHSRVNATTDVLESDFPACSDLRRRGEGNGFVLYNVICKGENGTIRPHHYYHNP